MSPRGSDSSPAPSPRVASATQTRGQPQRSSQALGHQNAVPPNGQAYAHTLTVPDLGDPPVVGVIAEKSISHYSVAVSTFSP